MNPTVRLLIGAALLMWAGVFSLGQEKEQMPRLEIPEITIVGKKAISLPFARKGEVEDVERYRAPEPDSTILGRRQTPMLPMASSIQAVQRISGVRASAQVEAGSFATARFAGRVSYSDTNSRAVVGARYRTTKGHVDRSNGRELALDARGSHFLQTDHDWLRTLRLTGHTGIAEATFNLFGIPNAAVERSRNQYNIGFGLSTAEKRDARFEFHLETDGTTVTDRSGGVEARTTAVSPKLSLVASGDRSNFRWLAGLEFQSTSLTSAVGTESPTVVQLTAAAHTALGARWRFRFGGLYARGRDTDGTTRSLASPLALAQWSGDENTLLSLWWEPQMRFTSFNGQISAIPYLAQGLTLKQSVSPVALGVGAKYTHASGTLEAHARFIKHRSLPLPVSPAQGILVLDYADGTEVKLDASIRTNFPNGIALSVFGTLRQAHEQGTTTQLPMIPVVQVRSQAEIELPYSTRGWASFELTGPQNVDRTGTRTIRSFVVMDVGMTSAALAPVSLTVEVRNLLNQSYEWWGGYEAPGFNLNLSAGVSL